MIFSSLISIIRGPNLYNVFDGLSCSTEYRYRVRCSNNVGPGPWSPIITVSTTSEYSEERRYNCVYITLPVYNYTGQANTSDHLHKAIQTNNADRVRKIAEEK